MTRLAVALRLAAAIPFPIRGNRRSDKMSGAPPEFSRRIAVDELAATELLID